MKTKHHNSNSFLSKTRIVLVLLGILPFLIIIYLFYYGNLDLTNTVILFFALSLFSILSGFVLLRNSSDQLINLLNQTSMATAGTSHDPIKINADQELQDIADNFNAILNKLEGADREVKEQSVKLMEYARNLSKSYERLRKEEKIRNRMSRYVGVNLVEKLVKSKKAAFPENERKETTVLFADIRSFTTIAEKMEAEDVLSMLNEYFDVVVEIIFKNNGILDKFLGDQLMAVFGAIPSGNSAPYDAVKSAIEMQAATEALMQMRRKRGEVVFGVGIGINTGSSIVGNVGAENRMDYTVIGDSVNISARLQQLAKGGEILIGEQTYRQIQNHFPTRKKGELRVKNKTTPVLCYEVIR